MTELIGISYADLYTLAGATAIEAAGGPTVGWRAHCSWTYIIIIITITVIVCCLIIIGARGGWMRSTRRLSRALMW